MMSGKRMNDKSSVFCADSRSEPRIIATKASPKAQMMPVRDGTRPSNSLNTVKAFVSQSGKRGPFLSNKGPPRAALRIFGRYSYRDRYARSRSGLLGGERMTGPPGARGDDTEKGRGLGRIVTRERRVALVS